MKLNCGNFVNALVNVQDPFVSPVRSWDTEFNERMCIFWNNALWDNIMEHDEVFGTVVDRYEFYNFCGTYCTCDESKKIFDKINVRSRCINYVEFEDFLEKLCDEDYGKIINCLELDQELELEQELEPKEIVLELDQEIVLELDQEIETIFEMELESNDPEPEVSDLGSELEQELELEPEEPEESSLLLTESQIIHNHNIDLLPTPPLPTVDPETNRTMSIYEDHNKWSFLEKIFTGIKSFFFS